MRTGFRFSGEGCGGISAVGWSAELGLGLARFGQTRAGILERASRGIRESRSGESVAGFLGCLGSSRSSLFVGLRVC